MVDDCRNNATRIFPDLDAKLTVKSATELRKRDPDMARLRGDADPTKPRSKSTVWPDILFPSGHERNIRYIFMNNAIVSVSHLLSCADRS